MIGRTILVLALVLTCTTAEAWPGKKKNKAARDAEASTEPTESAAEPDMDEVAAPSDAEAPAVEEQALDELLDHLILAAEDGASPEDVPAAELPNDEGIWAWVERMDDEIPSDEQMEAIREKSEEASEERELIEALLPESTNDTVYTDPVVAVTADPLHLDKVDPSEFDIPIEVNDEVRKWVAYFSGPRGRKYFQRWLTRSTRFTSMMHAELERQGLPKDLIYLSMIESGYNTQAYSHAHAAGLWQFIPSTARLYKIRVDWWVDDRRDPGVATAAGVTYLRELHKMFGDWRLAWASYNGGPGRVRRAISQSGSSDFWVLARGDYLHAETDNYVPKIMAAAIIGKHPERYGFEELDYQAPLTYDSVYVDGSVDLTVLAKCAGVSTAELQAYNPALRRWATPPEGYEVRVPSGQGGRFAAALASVPKSKRVTFTKHKVQKGDTLSGIAEKYGVSVSELMKANRLRNANRIYVGMSLVVPSGGTPPQALVASKAPTSTPNRPSTYKVKKGDSLSMIASRHGVTTSQLRSWNGIKSDTIYVGQTLKLKGSGSTSSGSTAQTVRYTVQTGDNLSRIASKYGVSVADLQRWNNISNASKIFVGQALKVQLPATSWTSYTVRSGDSLGRIAQRHGCSVRDLQDWNGLKSTVIHPGQKLKIRG